MPKYVIVVETTYHVVIETENMKEAKHFAEAVVSTNDLIVDKRVDEIIETDISCDECLTYKYDGEIK